VVTVTVRMRVRVAAVVVGVPVRHCLLVQRDLLHRDVRSGRPRSRRDELGERHGHREAVQRHGAPRTVTHRATQAHNLPSPRATLTGTA
jgi:hypothetical protein